MFYATTSEVGRKTVAHTARHSITHWNGNGAFGICLLMILNRQATIRPTPADQRTGLPVLFSRLTVGGKWWNTHYVLPSFRSLMCVCAYVVWASLKNSQSKWYPRLIIIKWELMCTVLMSNERPSGRIMEIGLMVWVKAMPKLVHCVSAVMFRTALTPFPLSSPIKSSKFQKYNQK